MARRGRPAGLAQSILADLNKMVRPAQVLGGGAQPLLPCRARAMLKDLGQGRRADLHQGLAAEGMRLAFGAIGGTHERASRGSIDCRAMVAIKGTTAACGCSDRVGTPCGATPLPMLKADACPRAPV